MNNKGIIMLYILIFTVLSCTIAISYFYFIQSGETSFTIGDSQENVIRSFAKSNEIKYYVNSNVEKYSKDSINSLLLNAGINEPTFNEEYILWKQGNKDCFPSDWEILKSRLATEIKNKFEEDVNIEIFRENIGLSIKTNIPISLNYEGDNYKITYSELAEKEIKINGFNFDGFINKASKIEDISILCNSDKTCWEKEISKLKDIKLVKVKDKLFKLELTTLSLDKEIIIKIALDFEEELNAGEKEIKC